MIIWLSVLIDIPWVATETENSILLAYPLIYVTSHFFLTRVISHLGNPAHLHDFIWGLLLGNILCPLPGCCKDEWACLFWDSNPPGHPYHQLRKLAWPKVITLRSCPSSHVEEGYLFISFSPILSCTSLPFPRLISMILQKSIFSDVLRLN